MSLTRWDPYRDRRSLREALDRLLEESLVPSTGRREESRSAVPVPLDMFETDEGYVVKSDLPGLKPEDVDISISENVLTIKGEFREEEARERENVHVKERRFGAFQRSVSLPGAVEAEGAEASFEDGVLRVTLPKVDAEQPKRIEVEAK